MLLNQEIDLLESKIGKLFDLQKRHSISLRKSTVHERLGHIKRLREWVVSHKEDIQKALFADYRKPYTETDITEIYPVLSEAKHYINNLAHWMKSKRMPTPLTFLGTKAQVHYEPKGASLIIAPWNYPFNLAIGPLVAALGAGCTAIVKPSEMTPHTSALIRRMVGELFDERLVTVVEGGVEASQVLLSKPFAHIFFTGSPAVGKIVMKAAAEHLTSVTLELGGKSPAIIAEDSNLKDAAEKIAATKFLNCGQTCVAPDYALIHHSKCDPFLQYVREAIDKMFKSGKKGVEKSPDYSRIVNERHFNRIMHLLQDASEKGAKIEIGGKSIPEENFLEPTVLVDVYPDMLVMQEEIFGPILPVMVYENLEQALALVNEMPKPLALYAFSNSSRTIRHIFEQTSSGASVANDCALHFLHPELPFGGVNNSGIGKSHGVFGFLEFSNQKAVLEQRVGFTAAKPLFPPYNMAKKKMIEGLLKWF
jgi:aldehyde dehydrogenase (NAD+)